MARRRIERPRLEDQEKHYREEQERLEQEEGGEYITEGHQEPERFEEEKYESEEQIGVESESEEQMGVESEEAKEVFKTEARRDIPTNTSSWWEERRTIIERPSPEDQERRYREEQERYEQERQTESLYNKPIQELLKEGKNIEEIISITEQERRAKEVKKEGEEKRDISQVMSGSYAAVSRIVEDSSTNLQKPWIESTVELYSKAAELSINATEKIFQDYIEMPTKGSTAVIFETYGGMPDIYFRNFAQIAKLWNDSYQHLFRPWVDSMPSFSEKMAELSRGEARPEAYKEFYDLWIDTYRNTYNSWISMYERAFDDFFTYVPVMSPIKPVMEPVKKAARAYTDMFSSISDMWMRPVSGSTSTA